MKADKNPAAHERQPYDQSSVAKTIDVASGRAWVCKCKFVMHRDESKCGNCGAPKPETRHVRPANDLFGGLF